MPCSRGSSPPRDQTRVSYVSWIGSQILYHPCHPQLVKKKKCHRRVDLNYVNLFSYTSGCCKSQIWVPGWCDSGETYTSRQLPSPHVLIWGESFGISSSSFKDTSSVRSGLHLITLFSLKLNYLLKDSCLQGQSCGVGAST